MILLEKSMITGLDEAAPAADSIYEALQKAIKLEHATIPTYLYALYSLDPSRNKEIAEIVDSVVIEEMLHMTLASNVLNALGVCPVIDHPDFIPNYPGPLPGGVESGLTVHLAPFSTDQLETFLDIEQPEHPLNFKAFAAVEEPVTIGQFYAKLSAAIAALGDSHFVGDPRFQVGPDLLPESIVVRDVATAQQAIELIVEQGEGTTTSPAEVVGGDVAHYYRFMEIKKGRRLVPVSNGGPDPEDQWAYDGDPVPFDVDGVYPVPTDPGPYAPGTVEAFANDNFNYTYTSLLRALHQLFNGRATTGQLDRALGLMMSLKGQAMAMTSGMTGPKYPSVGPTFQYQPVNPAT